MPPRRSRSGGWWAEGRRGRARRGAGPSPDEKCCLPLTSGSAMRSAETPPTSASLAASARTGGVPRRQAPPCLVGCPEGPRRGSTSSWAASSSSPGAEVLLAAAPSRQAQAAAPPETSALPASRAKPPPGARARAAAWAPTGVNHSAAAASSVSLWATPLLLSNPSIYRSCQHRFRRLPASFPPTGAGSARARRTIHRSSPQCSWRSPHAPEPAAPLRPT
mmetsp:Transcript_87838/g.228022  ORF Transcript_87838/g.228022 Transcript_87838/m.228022 type:complete len:220 (+) Transcript_87838:1969-2628(+)